VVECLLELGLVRLPGALAQLAHDGVVGVQGQLAVGQHLRGQDGEVLLQGLGGHSDDALVEVHTWDGGNVSRRLNVLFPFISYMWSGI